MQSKDKGCGTILLAFILLIVVFFLLAYAVAIHEEHPLLSIIVALFAVILAILCKVLLGSPVSNNAGFYGAICPHCKSTDTYRISIMTNGFGPDIDGESNIPNMYMHWHCKKCGRNFF